MSAHVIASVDSELGDIHDMMIEVLPDKEYYRDHEAMVDVLAQVSI